MSKSIKPVPGSLREEIALLRVCVEARFNQCQNEADLLLHVGEINALVLCIERLVTTEVKLVEKRAKLERKAAQTVRDLIPAIVDIAIGELTIDPKATAKIVAQELKRRLRRGV